VCVDPSGRFAYVANFGSDNVSAYTINASTGVLTEIDQNGATAGTAVAAGSHPFSISIDPSGKFAYVANLDSDTVSAYTINATTGALTSVGADVAAGDGPFIVTVDPSGQFAYVGNSYSNTVSTYTINATTGVLTPVGSSVASGNGPRSITISGTIQ
jgi:YVTN family beta-propeller protein